MTNTKDYKPVWRLLDQAQKVLLTTHRNPDGDACGCLASMHRILTDMGKDAKILLLTEIPQWYNFLFDENPPVLNQDLTQPELLANKLIEPDLIMIFDTNSRSQLPGFCDYLQQNQKPVVVIDHHRTSDHLGDIELVDPDAAAAALILFDLIKFNRLQITPQIARALFVAIATDTGWLRFNNADSRAFYACAELVDLGADPAPLYRRLYENFSTTRFNLMVRMLNSLRLHLQGRLAVVSLLQEDFRQTGATDEDTENLINECQRLSSVQVAAFFVELPDGNVKCSLRSSGSVDVGNLAQSLGGGGHRMASGVHLGGPMEKAEQLIFENLEEQFDRLDSI